MIFHAESVQVRHVLALTWDEATDGTPVAYDDGVEYDYIEATWTARLLPAELQTVEAAWQSSTRIISVESSGWLLGPTISTASATNVRIMDFRIDGPADSAMSLFDVTLDVRYGPMAAPSTGSLTVVQDRGVPYHTDAPNATAWGTEGGGTDVSTYGRISTRQTQWYSSGLTTAQAADVVHALRNLRGSSTTWTGTGLSRPFGPGQAQSATVWIPALDLVRESNLTWMANLTLVRNG